jgi:hypothetical protein
MMIASGRIKYLHSVLESVVMNEMRSMLRVDHLEQLGVRVGNLECLLPLPTLHVQLAQQLHVSTLQNSVIVKTKKRLN